MPITLNTHSVTNVDHLTSPDDFYDVTLDSPALNILTDFKMYRPLFIHGDTDIVKAKELMEESNVKWEIVVDSKRYFLGTLNLDDISGQNLLALTSKNRPPEDISVLDVMSPRNALKAISIQDMQKATVADVVQTLKDEHCEHFLVTNPETHRIRGVLAANEIARRLHRPTSVQDETRLTFYQMFKMRTT